MRGLVVKCGLSSSLKSVANSLAVVAIDGPRVRLTAHAFFFLFFFFQGSDTSLKLLMYNNSIRNYKRRLVAILRAIHFIACLLEPDYCT